MTSLLKLSIRRIFRLRTLILKEISSSYNSETTRPNAVSEALLSIHNHIQAFFVSIVRQYPSRPTWDRHQNESPRGVHDGCECFLHRNVLILLFCNNVLLNN